MRDRKKLKEKFQRKNVNGVSRDGDKEKGGREGADEEMTLNLNEKQSDYLRCV